MIEKGPLGDGVNQSVALDCLEADPPAKLGSIAEIREDTSRAARAGGVMSKAGNGASAPRNKLYYGDNLHWLEKMPPNTADLVYLDPPFNSQASYNILYHSPEGEASPAQYRAFEDSWSWDKPADIALSKIMTSGSPAAEIISSLHNYMQKSDLMAYLVMMTARLIELHRVLKPTGSLYLHCDPGASHYLKILLDAIFGPTLFRNEIIWQRTTPKGHAFTRFPSTHDVLLSYGRSDAVNWHAQYSPHRQEYIESHYSNIEPKTGRRYMLDNCLNPNPDRPNLTYDWKGLTRVWRWTK